MLFLWNAFLLHHFRRFTGREECNLKHWQKPFLNDNLETYNINHQPKTNNLMSGNIRYMQINKCLYYLIPSNIKMLIFRLLFILYLNKNNLSKLQYHVDIKPCYIYIYMSFLKYFLYFSIIFKLDLYFRSSTMQNFSIFFLFILLCLPISFTALWLVCNREFLLLTQQANYLDINFDELVFGKAFSCTCETFNYTFHNQRFSSCQTGR